MKKIVIPFIALGFGFALLPSCAEPPPPPPPPAMVKPKPKPKPIVRSDNAEDFRVVSPAN